jgi:hypothetical protein
MKIIVALIVAGFAVFMYARYRINKANYKKEYDRGFSDGGQDLFARSHTEAYGRGYSAGLSNKSKELLNSLNTKSI